MSELWSRPKSLYDIAGELADNLDTNSTAPTPRSLAADNFSAPTAATNTQPPTNPSNVNAFFNSQYDRIVGLANEMNIPPNLLLGLSAAESTWGQPPEGQNNLFGITTSKGVVNYPSFDDSIDDFRNSQWFSRLQNKNTVDDFVHELVDTTGGKKMFNSVNPHYDEYIKSVIDTVNRRLPIWKNTR